MSGFTAADFAESLHRVAETLAAHRDELCRLDGVVGDGDHGLAMADGFAAAAKAASEAAGGTLAGVGNAAAKALLNAVGASSGPLYATALMHAAKAAGPRAAMPLAETPALIAAMAQGIVTRGKAAQGERTMVDAWAPAAAAAPQGYAAMRAAAAAGAEATKAMIATKGRTSRLGERALGHIDPGAASAVLVIEALTRHWESL
ncbi:MAG TPA: dihydroxyacetone kinase subunit DhaL [Roseiarcus sp.]|nr:dihydroxyacetone kinase subunit DhaL [Roseiarcus sp.]